MKKAFSILITLILVQALLLPAAATAGIESISLSTYQAGSTPSYQITYRLTGNDLIQAPGDYISVIFPTGTALPASIPPSEVQINTLMARDVRVFQDQARIDILVPADISSGQIMDIMIKQGAGIKNPPSPGRNVISVMNPKSLSLSQFIYNISAGSVSQPEVFVSPAFSGASARYNMKFYPGSQGDLTGGADTITISFPAGTQIPQVIDSSSITVNGYPAQNGSVVKSGLSLTFGLPVQVSVPGLSQVIIDISKSAGILNGPAGSYSLGLSTSRETMVSLSETYTISGGSVSSPRVVVTPPAPGSAAEYEISFNVSANGDLNGGTDTISITFPQAISLPSTMPRSAITVNGTSLNGGVVSLTGKRMTFTVPYNVSVEAEGAVTVKISPQANIKNPLTPGNNYILLAATSKDSVSTASLPYAITDSEIKIETRKTISLVIDSKTAFIDAKPVLLDVPATILNGRTLVPIRFVSESLGATVKWNQDTQEVTVALDGKNIVLTVDSDTAWVDGNRVNLDTSPVIKDGRTLVPIRFLAENFGGGVAWDSETRTVTISK